MRRGIILVLPVVVIAVGLVLAGSDEVRALVAAARYDEARSELARDPELRVTASGRLLSARLGHDPVAALGLLQEVRDEAGTDSPLGREAALDAAGIALGAGQPREALEALTPLLAGDRSRVPGRAVLLAGLAARSLGQTERAERLLAGVRPDDPSFGTARVVLGELSLAKADPQRALRYFEAVGEDPMAAAGRWQAYRDLGDDGAADGVLEDLRRRDPGGLSLLEINRRQRQEADEASARRTAAVTIPDTVDTSTRSTTAGGRYTLQFGAWSDRGRALDMVRRYRDQIPDLHIVEARDDRGQLLYKVRSGAYANPALARTEARRLEDRLGLDVFVTDRSD